MTPPPSDSGFGLPTTSSRSGSTGQFGSPFPPSSPVSPGFPPPAPPPGFGGGGSAGGDYPPGFGTGGAPLTTGRPPVRWLGSGFAAAVIGLLLVGVLGTRPVFAIVGWVLVGPVAISFVAGYITGEAKAKDVSIYAAPTWVPWAFRLLIVLCLVGAAAAAARIGLWVGRW